MDEIQTNYIKDLTKESDKVAVLSRYMQQMQEHKPTRLPFSIDTSMSNIFVEYFTNQLVSSGRIDADNDSELINIYFYIVYYHPKFYELIMEGKTIDEYNDTREKLQHVLASYEKDTSTDPHIKTLRSLFDMAIHTDNITALEYCYFLTWASFDMNATDVPKQYFIENNINDILAINITYNLQYLESIIMYKRIPDTIAPVLTEELVAATKRYKFYPIDPKNVAKKPITLYDKNFKEIDKLNTNEVTVLLDYGNGYYTKLLLHNEAIRKNFANDIIARRIKTNRNKMYLFDIVNKDLFEHLPSECYKDKLSKELLYATINTMYKIVSESFNETDKNKTIQNILHHPLLLTILAKEEIPIFTLYLQYIPQLELYTHAIISKYCCDYIYEDIIGSSIINN